MTDALKQASDAIQQTLQQWDGGNQPTDRYEVLAQAVLNAIGYAKMREALEWYALPRIYETEHDGDDYGYMEWCPIEQDAGQRARDALGVPHE